MATSREGCPLCGSHDVLRTHTVPVEDLVYVYRRTLGERDIASEFAGLRELDFHTCNRCDLRFFLPAVTGSERFYEMLQEFDGYYSEDKSEYRFAAGLIPAGATVLDVGCGKGAFARLVPQASYTGLEFSLAAQKAARQNGVMVFIESVEAHAARCPAAYDAVCAFQVLEHVVDVRAFVQASADCAREGGLVIFSVPAADSFAGRVANYALNLPPHHVTWWTDECLQRLGPLFGLEVVRLEPEPLAPIHHPLYAHTRLMNALGSLWNGAAPPLIDPSLRHRLVSRIASVASRGLLPRLRRANPAPRGQSITAIYRKPRVGAAAPAL